MEQIIKFLEEYWGVAIFGAGGFGTLVTFTVAQIKALIQNKLRNNKQDALITDNKELRDELVTRDDARTAEYNKTQEDYKQLLQQYANNQEYFEKVISVLFKAISHLILASKLPNEDKIAIMQQFESVSKQKIKEYTDKIEPIIKEEIVPDVKEIVEQSVEQAKTLLDKYMQEE